MGGGSRSREKYKSAYMTRSFTAEDGRCMYKHMTRTIPGVDLRNSMVAIDSYGGAINRKNLVDETAAAQRSSVMKLQYQTYWREEKDDDARLKWIRDFYLEMNSCAAVDS